MDPWTVAGVTAGAVGAAGYAVRGRSSQVFGRSFYHGNKGRAEIALTFDDGPSPSTPALLDVLAKYGVRATFFMCGHNVRRLPDVARAVHQAGHEIGNHTDSHPYLHFKSPEFVYRELATAQETIRTTTGADARWFRAPFGVRWFGVSAAQKELGLTGVMWDVLAGDWKWPGERVAEKVMRGAKYGSIVCLHDGRRLEEAPEIGATIKAVATVIPKLRDRGLGLVTVTEILR